MYRLPLRFKPFRYSYVAVFLMGFLRKSSVSVWNVRSTSDLDDCRYRNDEHPMPRTPNSSELKTTNKNRRLKRDENARWNGNKIWDRKPGKRRNFQPLTNDLVTERNSTVTTNRFTIVLWSRWLGVHFEKSERKSSRVIFPKRFGHGGCMRETNDSRYGTEVLIIIILEFFILNDIH